MDEAKWAAQNGDVEKLREAIGSPGFNINGDVGMGRQLIHCAADYGQTEVLQILLANGADVNAKDKHGITPLLNAIFEGHARAVKLLLEKGADKTVKAPSGESAFESADKDEIKELLK